MSHRNNQVVIWGADGEQCLETVQCCVKIRNPAVGPLRLLRLYHMLCFRLEVQKRCSRLYLWRRRTTDKERFESTLEVPAEHCTMECVCMRLLSTLSRTGMHTGLNDCSCQMDSEQWGATITLCNIQVNYMHQ